MNGKLSITRFFWLFLIFIFPVDWWISSTHSFGQKSYWSTSQHYIIIIFICFVCNFWNWEFPPRNTLEFLRVISFVLNCSTYWKRNQNMLNTIQGIYWTAEKKTTNKNMIHFFCKIYQSSNHKTQTNNLKPSQYFTFELLTFSDWFHLMTISWGDIKQFQCITKLLKINKKKTEG